MVVGNRIPIEELREADGIQPEDVVGMVSQRLPKLLRHHLPDLVIGKLVIAYSHLSAKIRIDSRGAAARSPRRSRRFC